MKKHQTRERRIEIVQRRLLRKSMPRFQVSLILLFTGVAGFLASFSLLHLNVFKMWLRYPFAILVAYCVFLLLLRLWLWAHGRQLNAHPDLSGLDHIPVESVGESFHFGGGGDFGGGGAGGSWGESITSSSTAPSSGSAWSGVGFDLPRLIKAAYWSRSMDDD